MVQTPYFLRFWISLTALASLLSISMVAVAQQDASSQSPTTSSNQATSSQASTPPSLPDAPSTGENIPPPQVQPEGPTAVFDTSMGRMVCKLYSKESPLTVANFIGLATGSKKWTDSSTQKTMQGKPYFNSTTFHRVIPGFMIQGGDPTGTGHGDPGYFINDELDPSLNFEVAGMLAMANAGPNTDGSQFFITVAPYPSLDGHYSIFGKCNDASVLVAESIADVERDGSDKPLQPVMLNKVTIVENGKPLPPDPAAAASASATPTPASPTPAAPAAAHKPKLTTRD